MSSFDDIFGGQFDADAAIEDGAQVEAQALNEPLPAGEYKVMIEKATDIAPFDYQNESTTRTGFKLACVVIEGEYEGRKIFNDITIADSDESEKAQKQLRIEMGRFGALVKAVGWASANGKSPSDFIDCVAIAKIIVWKNKTTGKIRNFVNGWKSADGATAPAPKTAPKVASAPKAAPAKKMPWMK